MADNKNSKKINFYKPNKRFIIPIKNFHVPKKLYIHFKKTKYKFKINYNYLKVIKLCQSVNRNNKDTWINDIIINTYYELFKINKSHSVECYENEKLIGGLYGVHLGSCFFGESMFSSKTNASKFCLLYLLAILKKNLFMLLDSQYYNSHLTQFGAYEISNETYIKKLKKSLKSSSKFLEIKNFYEVLSLVQPTSHKS